MKKQIIVGAIAIISFFTIAAIRSHGSQSEFISSLPIQELEAAPSEENQEMAEATPLPSATLMVDLKGSVRFPGIYELQEGNRIHDAIILAGGLTDDAAVNWVNLAQRLVDEMVIFIPSIHDEDLMGYQLPAGNALSSRDEEDGLININKASAEALTALPGIGASRAEAIVRFREENGNFQALEQLKNVSGIGDATFANLKHLIRY